MGEWLLMWYILRLPIKKIPWTGRNSLLYTNKIARNATINWQSFLLELKEQLTLISDFHHLYNTFTQMMSKYKHDQPQWSTISITCLCVP